MPEEVNRVLTDQLADLLFVTEKSALRNLAREGIPDERVHFVGNTMIDSLLRFRGKAEASRMLEELGLRDNLNGSIRPYVLLTLHRPANVDSREAFLNILEGLQEVAGEYTIIFPAHPRTQNSISALGLEHYFQTRHDPNETAGSRLRHGQRTIRIIRPLSYLDFLCLMKKATLIVTDSGGVQEETTCLGIPCVTVRENTERPATIEHGTNILAGVKEGAIRRAIRQQLNATPVGSVPEKWDGGSAARILDVISREFQKGISTRRESPKCTCENAGERTEFGRARAKQQ
jgi:UDP-N-acetylglucosamine 2-epimerase (non-hydrolysing)